MSWIYFTYIYTTSSLRVDNCYFIWVYIKYTANVHTCTMCAVLYNLNIIHRDKFNSILSLKKYNSHRQWIGNRLIDWLIDWCTKQTKKTHTHTHTLNVQIHTFQLALILWFSNQQQNTEAETEKYLHHFFDAQTRNCRFVNVVVAVAAVVRKEFSINN